MTVFNDVIRPIAMDPAFAQAREGAVAASIMVKGAAGISLAISSALVARSIYKICTTNSNGQRLSESIGLVGNVVAGVLSYDAIIVAGNVANLAGRDIVRRAMSVVTTSYFVDVILQNTLLGGLLKPFAIDALNIQRS